MIFKFGCLLCLGVVLAQEPEESTATKEIQDEAGFLARAARSFRSIPAPFEFKPVACGNRFAPKGVNGTCYSLEASADALLPALIMYTGTYEEASLMIGDRTDRIRITAETNPSCSFIQTDIKALAPAMVGPSSIEITNYHSRKATKNLLLAANTSISTKLLSIGKFTLDVSHEYNRNLMNEKGSGEGIIFRAPAGETCVPSVVSTLFICKGFTGDFVVGETSRSAPKKKKTVPGMPISLFRDGIVMASHYGCIDYS
ncbi:hypothetical protein DSO57_1009579 [Entomophthora muscae]|uniref:Uncharacterized protein n=1 Tax=Entomophthora muscae TaxID=34485 RepID=A0ACC2TUB8_9FUNG|nr:hypothetical protein DSO57_1009579 [Entomophthora muscae]